MKILNKVIILLTMALPLVGCESETENNIEDAGEAIEEKAEDAGDAAEDAAEDTEDAVEDALD